jgi:Holliday junction DNA helicase RuvA
MIAQLRGILDDKDIQSAVVDVQGVGYAVTCSSRTLEHLVIGAPVVLAIETQFRAEHLELFGFLNAEDRQWFRLLQTVQGVGARVALAIQSCLSGDEILTALSLQDAKSFTRAEGVGPKLAARIVMELKDKAPRTLFKGTSVANGATIPSLPTLAAAALQDAMDALVQLGYRRGDVQMVLHDVVRTQPDASVETLIKLGLQHLAQGLARDLARTVPA